MDKIKSLVRCTHRKGIDDHGSCFATGNVVDKRPDKTIPWYKEEGIRIGYLDIESDGLVANFNTALTWCVKEKDGDTRYDVISKSDLFNDLYDYNIIKSLVEELRKYKIIVTYYGTGFDIPFVRTKALHYGIDFPSYADLYHFDLYYTVKSRLSLQRNSLKQACEYLGIVGKTDIDTNSWRKAKYGDPEALREVLSHNIGDVEILEQLHEKLNPFAKWTKKSI